jgi:hypothetical protein
MGVKPRIRCESKSLRFERFLRRPTYRGEFQTMKIATYFQGWSLGAPTDPAISIQPATSAPRAASKALRPAPADQLILGADKRNPLLSVYHDQEHRQLLVYYGFEIIEIVPDNTQAGS